MKQEMKKCKTGVAGLDELTRGGLPCGRTTLISGRAGCGKTILTMQFLLKGAKDENEPGLFISFEENLDNITTDFSGFGIDIPLEIEKQKLAFDYVNLGETEITEVGDFTLEPLKLRIRKYIEENKVKRLAIDTIESLFSAVKNKANLRIELHKLFRWLSEQGITTVITAELTNMGTTRYEFEEFLTDCVIILDSRIVDQVSKRRLKIVKYRGSDHSKDECPFIINENGFSVIPLTTLELNYGVSSERISSGVEEIDELIEETGFHRGSSILISGSSGTGKSSIANHFVEAACSRGEKALYISFEEPQEQIIRNMKSIGIDLEQYVKDNLLTIKSERSSSSGLEEHLVTIVALLKEIDPSVVVIDPISNFFTVGSGYEIRGMLTRLIDNLKKMKITSLFTSLTTGDLDTEQTNVGISSLMDTWMIVKDYDVENEKRRLFYILKSRGTNHSREMMELKFSPEGIKLNKPDFFGVKKDVNK